MHVAHDSLVTPFYPFKKVSFKLSLQKLSFTLSLQNTNVSLEIKSC